MSGFKGNKKIEIQPNDANVSYGYEFTICSSTTSNDGFLPNGTTVSGVSVVSYKTADANGRALASGVTEVDDLIQGVPTVSSNTVTVRLSYPATNGLGYYKMTFLVTASDSSVQEIDYDRVCCLDK